MRFFFLITLIVSMVVRPVFGQPDSDDPVRRVVIVVNEADAGSVRIGEYYAERRGIPKKNIVSLKTSRSETISRDEFVETIHNPLQLRLLEDGWLEGMPTRLTDSEGRYRSVIQGHRMSYLVLCRGIPLRIEHDESRVTEELRRAVGNPLLAVNSAAVDSELALMTALLPSIALIQNPLFQNRNPSPADLARVIKVARLDGPTIADAMGLVDSAIEGERKGLRGRGYIDLEGPHLAGVSVLRAAGAGLEALGFDVDYHEGKGTYPETARFDAPALYFGWYTNHLNGPFRVPGFRFPPGAVAFHIHSFSAQSLRSDSRGWTGPLVARGVAATFGNVYEPYLEWSHRPDLVVEWIAGGGRMGDAAAYAISGFSWQAIFVGDPLYRPFGRTLEEQLDEIAEGKIDRLSGYSVIREMNLRVREGRIDAAIAKGEAASGREPSLALALKVAQLKEKNRQRREAARVFAKLEWKPEGVTELMLGKEVADYLSSLDAQEEALRFYRILVDEPSVPDEMRRVILRDGLLVARRLNERRLVERWQEMLEGLSRKN